MARFIPNSLSCLAGKAYNNMTIRTYVNLEGKDIDKKAWFCISEKVAKEIAGNDVIHNPSLIFKEFPIEPGLLIFNVKRSFTEWITGKKKPAIPSELVWDFYPKWAVAEDEIQPMKLDTKENNPEFRHRYVCAFKPWRGKEKRIQVDMFGKTLIQLNNIRDLNNRVVNMELFEDTVLNDKTLHVVEKVFYVDRLQLTVYSDGIETVYKEVNERFPVGFTVRKVRVGSNSFQTRCIKHVSQRDLQKMNVSWVHRSQFSNFFRQCIANSEKYGPAAGDVDRYIHAPVARRRDPG